MPGKLVSGIASRGHPSEDTVHALWDAMSAGGNDGPSDPGALLSPPGRDFTTSGQTRRHIGHRHPSTVAVELVFRKSAHEDPAGLLSSSFKELTSPFELLRGSKFLQIRLIQMLLLQLGNGWESILDSFMISSLGAGLMEKSCCK